MRGTRTTKGILQDKNPATLDPLDVFLNDELEIEQDDGMVTAMDEPIPRPPPGYEAKTPLPVVNDAPPSLPATYHHDDGTGGGLFGHAIEHEDSIKSVAKQLFTHDVIDLKTDISHNEINNLTRLRFLQEKFKVGKQDRAIDNVINSFLRLRVSKDRKSRAEFIAALQTENRNTQGGSIWSRMLGAGGGSQP